MEHDVGEDRRAVLHIYPAAPLIGCVLHEFHVRELWIAPEYIETAARAPGIIRIERCFRDARGGVHDAHAAATELVGVGACRVLSECDVLNDSIDAVDIEAATGTPRCDVIPEMYPGEHHVRAEMLTDREPATGDLGPVRPEIDVRQ